MKTAVDKYIQQGRDIGLQEGISQGISQGISLGKANLILGILERKFGKISGELTRKIESLSEPKIEELGYACFGFQDKKELENWLKSNK